MLKTLIATSEVEVLYRLGGGGAQCDTPLNLDGALDALNLDGAFNVLAYIISCY